MQKIYSNVACSLLLLVSSHVMLAGNFSFSPSKTVIFNADCDTLTGVSVDIINGTSSTLYLDYVVLQNTLVDTSCWDLIMCDNAG